tara:strand:+ start:7621 stop:8523 length:903 start_codon:yes stop_codon:yes gene_type:complete
MESEQEKILSPLGTILSYWRFAKANLSFTNHPIIGFKKKILPVLHEAGGDKSRLRALYNNHQGKRCFVLGNGPSLKKMDLNLLKDDIVIGSNGVYKLFEDFYFRPSYLVFQDGLTIAKKAEEINALKGIPKLVALHASHLIKRDTNTTFFYLSDHLGWHEISPDNKNIIRENLPQFSNNFSSVVSNLGNVSHTALQLAYFLGCDPIYIIGCDHSHGELCKYFPPGHIKITNENFHIFQQNHFTKNYYKLGDYIGVPLYDLETQGYKTAMNYLKNNNRKLINAGKSCNLDFIPSIDFKSLF